MIDTEAIALFASTATLGVFLGAQLLEVCVLVPIWKRMDPDDFCFVSSYSSLIARQTICRR